jgi:hypothetical protein
MIKIYNQELKKKRNQLQKYLKYMMTKQWMRRNSSSERERS